MVKKENIEKIILTGIGITKKAMELANSVYALKKSDSNIDRISFSRYSIKGDAGYPFLVADVELKEPFLDIGQFIDYLKSHKLPSTDSDILLEFKDPLEVGFQTNTYTTDAFCAKFYQPYRLRSKKD